MSHRSAVPPDTLVDELVADRSFHWQPLGLLQGRSIDHWVDRDFASPLPECTVFAR